MFKIAGIDHIVLNTHPLRDMLHFYCHILPCTIENTQPEFNLTQLRAGVNLIDLIEIPPPEKHFRENLNHFCLRIVPFDYEELKKYFEKNHIKNISLWLPLWRARLW